MGDTDRTVGSLDHHRAPASDIFVGDIFRLRLNCWARSMPSDLVGRLCDGSAAQDMRARYAEHLAALTRASCGCSF